MYVKLAANDRSQGIMSLTQNEEQNVGFCQIFLKSVLLAQKQEEW